MRLEWNFCESWVWREPWPEDALGPGAMSASPALSVSPGRKGSPINVHWTDVTERMACVCWVLGTRQRAYYLPYLIYPHNYSMKQALSYPHFTDEITEAQRSWGNPWVIQLKTGKARKSCPKDFGNLLKFVPWRGPGIQTQLVHLQNRVDNFR